MTLATKAVLQAIAAHGTSPLYGREIGKAAGLPSGTLYPILARLEEAGWVNSDFEQVDPHEVGRPRRRYYYLTGVGQERIVALKLYPAGGALA